MSTAAQESPAAWTVMFYVTASDLEPYAFAYINELELLASQLPPTVRLALFYDQTSGRVPIYGPDGEPVGTRPAIDYATGGGRQAPWGGAGWAIVRGDTDPDTIATTFDLSIGDPDAGKPATLETFVTWAARTAPADHYALVLVDHGAGIRGFSWDVESQSQSSLPSLRQALGVVEAGGIDISLVAYSGCNMGAAEVAYALRDVTSYVVGSEDEMWTDNWDYPVEALSELGGSPSGFTAGQLASQMVLAEDRIDPAQTLSAIRSAGVDGLASALRGFAGAVRATPMTVADWYVLQQARDAADGYGEFGDQRDLGQFMARVARDIRVDRIRDAAEAVLAAIAAAVDARTDTPAGDSGLTIYFPDALRPFQSVEARESGLATAYLDHAAFGQASGWLSFLRAFVARPRIFAPSRWMPPVIAGLRWVAGPRCGGHLVLTFTEPMDPARAEDRSNYRVVRAGPGNDHVIRVRRARYEAASQSVWLRFGRRPPRHASWWLTVVGGSTGGLSDQAGTPLAGDGTGVRGADPAIRLDAGALRRPIRLGLLPDGGFEAVKVGPREKARTLRTGNPALAPWRIISGSVDVQTSWPATEGRHTLDLNGVSAGTVEQTFATVPGRDYQLLFEYANNPDGPAGEAAAWVTVTGDGTLLGDPITHVGSTARHMRSSEFLGSFVADSAATQVRFASTTPGAYGIVLDAVSVIAVSGTGNPTSP